MSVLKKIKKQEEKKLLSCYKNTTTIEISTNKNITTHFSKFKESYFSLRKE